MKIDPEMYMKTKGRMTKWPIIIRAFVPGLRRFCEKWTVIHQSFGQKMHRQCDDLGEAGTKIGSSVHRPINPSAEPEVVLRWPNEPMVR
jgi:hypothetical protein